MLNKYLVTCTYRATGMDREGTATYSVDDISMADAICQVIDLIETEAWHATFSSMKISGERIGEEVLQAEMASAMRFQL